MDEWLQSPASFWAVDAYLDQRPLQVVGVRLITGLPASDRNYSVVLVVVSVADVGAVVPRCVCVGRSVSKGPACFGEFGAHRAHYETENQRLHSARINSVPFSKIYRRKEISPQDLARADFNDYADATRKSKHCKEISH
jgi:hypothetical protein